MAEFQSELREAGVGEPTIRKTLALLQSVCREAVTWGRLGQNPVKPARKRAVTRKRAVRPLAPETVERLRQAMGPRDAVLVSVLVFGRGEALALTWGHVRERTILVEQSASYGEIKSTKTRTTRSCGCSLRSSTTWRSLGSARDGHCRSGLSSRRTTAGPGRRRLERLAQSGVPAGGEATGLTDVRPYDLRHSFVSLLIAEGRSIVEVARQAGHSATMSLDTYGHVFDELDGAEKVDAEAAIWAARKPRCYLGATSERRIVAREGNAIPLFADVS